MLIPLHDYIVVEIEPRAEMIGSLYIPNTNNEKSQRAIVKSVGSEKCCCKVGDKVVIVKQCGIASQGNETLIYNTDVLFVEE